MSETQQPVVVYPNTVSSGQVEPSHSHSDGSFGTVFIVLAIIIVISSIACFLGRLCTRRVSQPKPTKQSKSSNARPKGNDIELGFDGRFPTAKPVGGHGGGGDQSKRFKMLGNEDPRGFRSMPGKHGDVKGFKVHGNGDLRGFRIHGNGNIEGDPKHVDVGVL
ncbi:hypothetical protein J1N35_042344 [Gossypium stocksii]|uniref:Uncharacterized protein n=1 Tax=Gossypium stocksii TaxID=47602 RepID=A0A9D3ZKB4_9ROSI|nr:hypothetical protein J1N35_042344 [Gossypium stocksii]